MTSDSWPGASPRLGRGAFAAGLIVLGSFIPSVPIALGASETSVEFKGELNYEAFKRAADKGASIRITQSPGGTGAAAMMLGRTKGLVIDGRCQSACAWAFVQNEGACFTKRASFDFHAAHDPGTGRRLQAATDYWLSTVGPELRARLSGLRSSSSLIRVSAKEMARYYGARQCAGDGRRAEIAAPAHMRVAALSSEAPVSEQATAGEAGRITTASIATRTAWSAADTQAGITAVRSAQDVSGISVAALMANDHTQPAETPAQPEATSFIGEVMAALEAEIPQAFSAWPAESQVLRDGVVTSVTTSAVELS